MAVATRSTSTIPFAVAQTALSYPWPRGMRPPSRREAEDMIEGLLAYLDARDGDPDFESSLGSIDATAHTDFMDQERWSIGYGQDREAGDDNGVADGDGLEWVTQPTRRAA